MKVQICQCVERCHVTWNLQIRSKVKLTKERFGKKTLIKTVLDFLLGRKKCEFLSTNTSPRLESVGILFGKLDLELHLSHALALFFCALRGISIAFQARLAQFQMPLLLDLLYKYHHLKVKK